MQRNRSFVLVLLAVLLSVALFAPTLRPAQAQESATDLARYFKADTLIFGSIRTDDAYIDALDSILSRVLGKLPAGMVPAVTLRGALTDALRRAGYDYQADVRSWLGNHAAFGIGMLASMNPRAPGASPANDEALLVIESTNRAAAEAFAEKLLANTNSRFDKTELYGGTAYVPQSNSANATIVVTDDAVMFGTNNSLAATLTREAKLNTAAKFTETIDELPAESYNLLLFVDVPALLLTQPGVTNGMVGAEQLVSALGPIAVGATILDARSLTLDVVQRYGDAAALEATGLKLSSGTPVDLAFAANLPANSTLVVHASNLKDTYESTIENLRALARLQGLSDAQLTEMLDRQLNQAKAAVAAFTGLDVDEDILSWLSGDYAVFVAYEPPQPGAPQIFRLGLDPLTPAPTLGIEAGLVIEATDAAKAGNVSTKLGETLTRLAANMPNTTITTEQVAGVDATVISVTTPQIAQPVQLVLAANDKVLVLGTRGAVETVLGGNGGFDKSAGLTEAAKYLLPNPTSIFYLDTNAVNLLGDLQAVTLATTNRVFRNIVGGLQGTPTPTGPSATATAQAYLQQELQQFTQIQMLVRMVAPILSSGTISSTTTEGGSNLFRFVLTVGE